jgi:hypothetical protein
MHTTYMYLFVNRIHVKFLDSFLLKAYEYGPIVPRSKQLLLSPQEIYAWKWENSDALWSALGNST